MLLTPLWALPRLVFAALGTRAPMVLPQGPNQRWSLDFVSDALAIRSVP